jgi:hypothetical protein
MPEYQVREEGTTGSIELTGIEGKQRELLDAFGECQSRRSTCPTEQ